MILRINRFFLCLVISGMLLFTYIFLRNVADQYEYCYRLLQTYGPICVKSAVTDFQTEDVSAYTSDGTNNYHADISNAFDEYLIWLNSQSGTDLYKLSNQIRTEFAEYGVTPMNYSLPYIDQERLQELATNYLNEQLQLRTTEDYRAKITVANVQINNVTREIKHINNSGIWGSSSTFYSAASSYEKLYEYNDYISYYIQATAVATISLELPILGGIDIAPYDLTYQFNIPYELVN